MLVSRSILFVFVVAATCYIVSTSFQQMDGEDELAKVRLSDERVVVIEVIPEPRKEHARLSRMR